MASRVQIYNMALGRAGVTREVSSHDEDSVEAITCRRYYESVRDTALRDFAWPFARRYHTLELVAEDPSDEWGYSYRYPTNCIKALYLVTGIRNSATPPPWELGHDDQGRLIYTDEADAVLRYIARITNDELFDESHVDALAWGLAAEIAIALGRSDDEYKRAVNQYLYRKGKAQSGAANEGQRDEDPDPEAVRARE